MVVKYRFLQLNVFVLKSFRMSLSFMSLKKGLPLPVATGATVTFRCVSPSGVDSRPFIFHVSTNTSSRLSTGLAWVSAAELECCCYYLSQWFLLLNYFRTSASLSKDSFQPCWAPSWSTPEGMPTCRKVSLVLPPCSSKVTVTSISTGKSVLIP
jgi:hypothetical protein